MHPRASRPDRVPHRFSFSRGQKNMILPVKAGALVVVLGLQSLLGLSPALATQDVAEDNTPKEYRCIPLYAVKRTVVIDDQTILFHMSGKRTLEVKLKYPCHSLKFYKFFSHKSHNNQLCANVDIIVSRSGSHCPIDTITNFVPAEMDQRDGETP